MKTRIRKHAKDQNHGKNGWVSGNPRYKRNRRRQLGGEAKKDRSMKGI